MKISVMIERFMLQRFRIKTIFAFPKYGGHVEFQSGQNFNSSYQNYKKSIQMSSNKSSVIIMFMVLVHWLLRYFL